jgi:hypothetical protein
MSMMSARRVTPALFTEDIDASIVGDRAIDHALDVGDASDVGRDPQACDAGGLLSDRAIFSTSAPSISTATTMAPASARALAEAAPMPWPAPVTRPPDPSASRPASPPGALQILLGYCPTRVSIATTSHHSHP